MVKGGGGGGVLEFNLAFNKDASNLVGYDPTQKQLYDFGAFSDQMNLHSITEIGNATGNTIRFEGFPTAMSVPYGLTGFANEEPQNLISISDIAVFEDLYPEDNVFTVYGNVSAFYYHGDGRYLSNITSNLQVVAEQDANTFRTLLMANAVTAFQVTSNILTSNGVIILGVDDDSPIKIGSSNYEGNWFSRTIALGSKAGHFTQMDDAIAIGTNAGANSQSATSIAIGANAAMISQNIQAIAIGLDSGATEQGVSAIAIGSNAGSNMQSFNAIAIGENAGMITQNIHAIAIGTGAALDNQASLAVAIGSNAGANNQGIASIAIGAEAGTNLQPNHSIIINASGEALEGVESNAFYAKPVRFVRDVTAIALGYTANNEIVDHSTITMSENLVSIEGTLRVSGNIHADGNLVAFNVENLVVQDPIVHLGNANQGVGYDTGFVMEQMDSNIALFYKNSSNELIISRTMNSAYDTTLTVDSFEHSNLIDTVNIFGNVTAFYHIGDGSLLSNLSVNIQDASLNGNVTTETILFENAHAAFVIDSNIEANTSITILNRDPTKNSVHIGSESYDAYGAASIGIGRLAGVTSQGEMAIAIGSNAGETEQGANSIAIGSFAGQTSQGGSSIAIGELAATTNQHMNTIVINASNAIALETTNADALYLAPVRDVTNVFSNLLVYSEENEVIKYSNMCTSNVGDLTVTDNIYSKRLFTDALTIGANIVMDDTFSNVITVTGNIFVSNVIQVGANLFIEEEGMNVLTIIGNAHVSNVVEVGSNAIINEFGSNVVFVEGNAHVTNVVTVGSNLVIDEFGSNVVFVEGNAHVSNVVTVGSNLVIDEYGSNVVYVSGNLHTTNVVTVGSNLIIENEGTNVLTIVGNAHVSNVVEVGSNIVLNEFGSNAVYVSGNLHTTNVVTVGSNLVIDEFGSNVVFVEGNAHISNVVTVGSNLVIDEFGSNVVFIEGNAHVSNVVTVGSNLVIDEFGSNVVFVEGNAHISNVVTVGSNLLIDEFGSNVVEISGNAHISDLLTIGSNVTIDEFGSNILTISGNAVIDPILQVGSNITMDDLASNALIVNGNIVADRIFLDVLAVGANLTIDDVASNVISVNGNISANYYFGDGGLLSNITIQVASDKGNTTTNTVIFSNTETGLKVDSNVMVEGGVVIVSNQGTGFGNVHIGSDNYDNYGPESIGIGYNAGESNQGAGAVAVGSRTAVSAQGSNAVALGSVSGSVNQGSNAVAVGVEAGLLNQGQDAIAVGFRAGSNFQGTNAVAIGKHASETNQHTGSIVINSSGNAFGSSNTDALFVKPIRDMTEFQSNLLAYTEEGEIVDFSNIYTSNVGDLSVSGNIYAKRIFTDAINVGANLVIDDVASNIIYVTGNIHTTGDLEAGNNVKAESNIYIGGLSALRYPMVDENNYLIDSNIYEEDGTVIVNTDAEISGNLIVHGTRTELATETMIVDDVIIGIANNNPSHALDTGIVMEHPGHNVGLIHHGDEDRFTIGYTQNTAADSSIDPDANNIHVDILGNLTVQNDFSVSNLLTVGANVVVGDQMTNIFVISGNVSANYYHGDGRFLSNVQVSIQDASDIGNVTTNTVQFVNNTMAFVTDYTSNVGMNLSQINNVTITDIGNGQVIKYSNTTNSWVNEYLDHTYIRVKNVEGAPISAGQVVYAAGATGNEIINIGLADASDPAKMPAIGIALENLATNAEGLAVSFGLVNSIAADFNEGDTLYVSNATPGEVSNVQPHGLTDLIQNIGVLVKGHASQGVAQVTGVGRANDIPNADIVAEKSEINYVYVSNIENDFYKIEVANLLTQTLAEVSNAGNITSNTVIFSNAETAMLIQQSNLGTDGALTVISTGSGAGNVHLGSESYDAYGAGSVGIGLNAGKTSQSSYAVGVGLDAGSNVQGVGGVSIGWNAGNNTQARRAVAIGQSAGSTSQGEAAIAIGRNAGLINQGDASIAIGQQAGALDQHDNSIIIAAAGVKNSGNSYATYINKLRGTTDVTANLIAYTDEQEVVDYSNLYLSNLQDLHVVGNVFAWQYYGDGGILSNIDVDKTLAEVSNVGNITSNTIIFSNAQSAFRLEDGNVEIKDHLWIVSDSTLAAVKIGSQDYVGGTSYSVGIGARAGQSSQGAAGVAIGYAAGRSTQGASATALGHNAGMTSQGTEGVAVGKFAGQTDQNAYATAIGSTAGSFYQADKATAVGYRAGRSYQGELTVAMGAWSGTTSQAEGAVAIGVSAGRSHQGSNAVAIGRLSGETSQHHSSIILNATGYARQTGNAEATYIHTLRDSTDVTANLIAYTDEGELVNYSNMIVSNLQDLTVTGNVIAMQYYGDGGLLTNVLGEATLAEVSNVGNITSNTIIFSNAETSFEVAAGTPNFASQVYIDCTDTFSKIRIGHQAGTTDTQGNYSIAIGGKAGQSSQGLAAVALGYSSGESDQANYGTAVGYFAGMSTQGQSATAIGFAAGKSGQNTYCVAVGYNAGLSAQHRGGVAVGYGAGQKTQGQYSVALGERAAQSYQEDNSIAVGFQAGWQYQNTHAIAIGHQAGRVRQNVYAVALGAYAGGTSQGIGSVAIGPRALCPVSNSIIISAKGEVYSASNANSTYINPIRSSNAHDSTGILTYTTEGEVVNYSNLYVQDGKLFNLGALRILQSGGDDTGVIHLGSTYYQASNVSYVAVGRHAANLEPGNYSTSIGLNAGRSYAAEQAISIGTNAGKSYAGYRSITMGHNSGMNGINSYSIALGYDAGAQAMNSYSIAMGISAGKSNQGENAISIGRSAGIDSQKDHAIAIGRGSGLTDQGNYSVAIGAYAGQTMPDNSIVLNATGSALNINTGNSKFFVKPVNSSAASAALNWNSSTGEIHTVTSDARTKINRQTIVNGLATVSNLTPQVYDKRAGMEEGDEVYGPESGLVAQDLWYDTPELRHAVILGGDAEPAEDKTPDDYSAWGNVASTIDYNQVIPYLISSIQELKARIVELENNN